MEDRPKLATCEACGRPSALRGKRCMYCGVLLPGAEVGEDDEPAYLARKRQRADTPDGGPVACGHCGHKVARRMARCVYCGTPVDRGEGQEGRPCPRCEGIMAVAPDGWVLVDQCETCKGQFFDASEFERVRKLEDRETRWFEKHLDPHPHDGEEGKALRCPVCKIAMETFRVGEGKEAILIDRCSRCSGLWLDDGEAEALRNLLFQGALRKESHDFGPAAAAGRGQMSRQLGRDMQMHATEAEREHWRYLKWTRRYGLDECDRYDRAGGVALGISVLTDLFSDD